MRNKEEISRIPFPCHRREAFIELDDPARGRVQQRCPICGRQYTVDFRSGTIQKSKADYSPAAERKLLDAIYTVLDRGNNVEIKKRQDGTIAVLEMKAKNIVTVG